MSITVNPTQKIKISGTAGFIAPYVEFAIRSEEKPASRVATHDAFAEFLGLDPLTQFA